MLKPIKSKAQERREIENQINDFLQHGGEVNLVASGISGREFGYYQLPPVTFGGERTERTPVIEQVQAIEARKVKVPAHKERKPRPRKVLITDDFGEPLRWEWKES